MFWTAEQDRQLDALLAEGLSASKIAEHMGISRNAVVGRVHRTKGLGAFARKPCQAVVSSRRAVAAKIQRARAAKPPTPNQRAAREELRRIEAETFPSVQAVSTELRQAQKQGIPTANGHRCTILELDGFRCRWPTWGNADEHRLYCGDPTEFYGASYCAVHNKINFASPEARRIARAMCRP